MLTISNLILWLRRTLNGYASTGADFTLSGVSTPGSNHFSFDGVDDYIEFNANSMFSTTDTNPLPWTVAMWIYNNGTSGGLIGDIGLSGAINFSIELDTSKKIHIYWNNTEIFTSSASYTYFSNSWTHLTITYDGTTIKLYTTDITTHTDALRDSEDITLPHMTKSTTSKFRIGANAPNNGNTYFKGNIKDIRIYKIALTQDEVKGICSVQFNGAANEVTAYRFYEQEPNKDFIITSTLGTLTTILPTTYNTVEDLEITTYKARGSAYPDTVTKTITCKRYTYFTPTYNLTVPILLKISITSPDGTIVDHFGGSYVTGYWTTAGSNHSWSSLSRFWYHEHYSVRLEILDNNNNVLGDKMILSISLGTSNSTSSMNTSSTTKPVPSVTSYIELPFDINNSDNGTKFRIKIVRDCKNDAPIPTETERECSIEKNAITPASLCSIRSTNYIYCTEIIENENATLINIGNNGSLTARYFTEI